MATNIKLNLGDDANQSLTITPDGAEIRVKLWWQPSDEHWYVHIDVHKADLSYFVFGRRVVVDEALIRLPVVFELGALYCRRRSERSSTILKRDSFQSTHDLTYERD